MSSVLLVHVGNPGGADAGAFLYGNFDALRQAVPYAALTAALDGWVGQRLADRDTERARWQTRLAAALEVPDDPHAGRGRTSSVDRPHATKYRCAGRRRAVQRVTGTPSSILRARRRTVERPG
jgi:hypothetical protein